MPGCNKKVFGKILFLLLILIFYIPFAVVSLSISSAPYSQCLDYTTPMLVHTGKHGNLHYSATSLLSFLREIGIIYVIAIVILISIFIILVTRNHELGNRENALLKCLTLSIPYLGVLKPLYMIINSGFMISTNTALYCPSMNSYLIIILVVNVFEYVIWGLLLLYFKIVEWYF